MTPILPEDKLEYGPKETLALAFPFLINGYGLILNRNDFRNFCRHYAALRPAYDQLVRIIDELRTEKGQDNGAIFRI